ncbi:UvrD-helicase domain-containing protein [Brevibacillus fluminis]|uniref:UvrD-helicase domain-containing protein n=1 Tax=Brevibacillus fluminis TaxID=511487 RepID=UPI003F8C5BE9
MERLTASQRQAVEAKGSRILVSAGAGSGKTRVLVERVHHLTSHRGVAPERILALTFTDQSANEMKARIDRKMGNAGVAVLTFHRFCGRIVRDNPLLADVDPAFTLLDEATAKAYIREVIDRELYLTDSSELIEWIEECGEKTALELFHSFYESWRESPLDLDELREKTEVRLAAELKQCREELQVIMAQLGDLYHSGTITASATLVRMKKMMISWEDFTRLGGWRSSLKDEGIYLQAERCLHDLFSEVTKNVSREAKAHFEKLSIWKKDQLWREFLLDNAVRFRESIFSLMKRVDQAYRVWKEEYGWCDFADLQRKAYGLLHNHREICVKYGRMYDHILVDEFQDTSQIQQGILDKLEAGSNRLASLFMVGDARQSIYRFRGADVSGFERIRKQLGKNDSFVSLRENFRSSPSLVAFFAEMTKGLFGDEGTAPPGLSEDVNAGNTAIELMIPSPDETDDPREVEAQLIAQRIVAFGPALWGDIAILLQTRTHLARYQQALDHKGIPYVVYAGTGYWKQQEVQDLYHLLRTVENIEDDISLLGFLRGPLVGLSEHGMWKIAEQAGLRQGFLNFMAHEDTCCSGEDRNRLLEAKRIIWRVRSLINRAGLGDWLHSVLYEEGIAEKLGFLSFEPVIELADELERRGEFQLADLLLWWQRLREGDDKEETHLKEAANGKVRIMTIHAAKGLEFPIVIVPDLTHRYSKGLGRLHFSRDWGLANQYYHQKSKEWLPTLSYCRAQEEERRAIAEEQKRLLYVAITRAQERLIFSGAAAAFTDKPSIEECSNWFDWFPFLVPELRKGVSEQIVRRQNWSLLVKIGTEPSPFKKEMHKTHAMEKLVFRNQERQLKKGKSYFSNRMWSVTEWVELLADDQKNKKREGNSSFRGRGQNKLEVYEWGRVLHRVLEHLRKDHDLKHIREHLFKMALASVGVTSQEAHVFAWGKLQNDIITFLNSELHTECCHGKLVYSEMPFAIRLFENVQEKRALSLNGVIDKVWLKPDGKATIVDFKTHQYKNAVQLKRIVEKYTPQLQLYSYAVEKCLHWQVDRAGLYMTATGNFVEVPCDSQSRERLWEKMYDLWSRIEGPTRENEKRLFS